MSSRRRAFILAALLTFGTGARADDPLPLRIVPGVSTTLSLDGASGHDSFSIRGNAGQTLLLELNCGDQAIVSKNGLTVLAPGSGPPRSRELPTRESPGSPTDWINTLPASGIYQVQINRAWKAKYTIRVTLMTPKDSRLNPGLSPRDVAIDLSLFKSPGKFVLQRFEPPDFCGISDHFPAHLLMDGPQVELRIMRADGLKKTSWGDKEAQQRLARLESMLQSGGKTATPDALPLEAYYDAALIFWGAQQSIEADSWRGTRWLAAYGQDRGPLPKNHLYYVVQAISKDGKFFITLHANVEYRSIPRDLAKWSPQDARRYDHDKKFFAAFQRKVREVLNQASPESFGPDLREIDAAVRTLRLPAKDSP